MSYAPILPIWYQLLATRYVASSLKGAKPADLPVDRQTHFEFVLNMKAAAAMGLTIPTRLLAQVDEIID